MRLKKIRLAGFKSFVDPTNIPFPDAMTAIVGPNGCGKSNVIDAVRWVLGESSAKNLRGDAMIDVIFNGSTARKPVSQCSVELVFDNPSERLQGEYAKYAELSIKRLVTRDAQSSYFLNGSKCRRRDVTDLFLGTGLGPRSYAIIEQGMISRLIESKPQELRIFIEEAAGISKYKERRRDTENRIRHTRENLERLEDVRGELGKQLEKLQRQAAAATRFKQLKIEERRLKSQLAALRWIKYSDLIEGHQQQISELETALQQVIAEQRGGESGLLSYQQQQQQLKQQIDDLQKQLFRLSNEITRHEQSQLHNKNRLQQISRELQSLSADMAAQQQQQQEAQHQIALLSEQQQQCEPQVEMLELSQHQAAEQLAEREHQVEQQQQQWRQQERQLSEIQQRIALLENQCQSQQQVIERVEARQQQLQQQDQQIDIEALSQQVKRANTQAEQARQQLDEARQQAEGDQQKLQEVQQQRRQLEQQAMALRGEVQRVDAQIASLRTLQELSSNSDQLDSWIEQQQLNVQPLWQVLQVESGWETALETVLQHWLSVSCMAESVTLPALSGGQLISEAHMITDKPAGTLAAKIISEKVPAWLTQVHVQDSREQAIDFILHHGQSVVSPDGYWRGVDFQVQGVAAAEQQGMVQRANQLNDLEQQRQSVEQQEQLAQQTLEEVEQRLEESQQQSEVSQKQLDQAREHNQQQQSQLQLLQQQLNQLHTDKQKLQDELQQQDIQLEQERMQLQVHQEQLEEQRWQLEQQQQQMPDVESERERAQQMLRQQRQQQQQLSEQYHQLALQLQRINADLNSHQQAQSRSAQQVEQLQQRQQTLQEEQLSLHEPLEQSEMALQEGLEQKLELDNQQHELADRLSEVESYLADNRKGQQAVQDKIQRLKDQQQALQVECEGHRVRANAAIEPLEEMGLSLKNVLEELPEDAEESQWQAELDKTIQSVSRLGAVNLAAVEEFDSQSERKAHLDSQHEDLTQALETLEGAIRKIDRETRSRFRQTFDQVNGDLQTLFPKVFGGGAASLELTDDDLLETGVAIMAQPPGKKNSTIHLLSGGEKALTALSLVFAIFRLNPAPFCMLDEVDAPLDDANVMRFCKLVSEMSESVQFIYITHNKIAMEMASHLTGVTMAEPGVSRMVAVDVEQAVALAEA